MNRSGPFDSSTTPIPQPDGRFAVELRFRIDPAAPADRVTTLHRILRVRPQRTAILFAIPERGLRAIRIVGPDVGDVYTFANRVADAIREIGDLVREPSSSLAASAVPAPEPKPSSSIGNDDAPPRWSYEPPGTFLQPEAAPVSAPVALARGVLAGLSRLLRRDKPPE